MPRLPQFADEETSSKTGKPGNGLAEESLLVLMKTLPSRERGESSGVWRGVWEAASHSWGRTKVADNKLRTADL